MRSIFYIITIFMLCGQVNALETVTDKISDVGDSIGNKKDEIVNHLKEEVEDRSVSRCCCGFLPCADTDGTNGRCCILYEEDDGCCTCVAKTGAVLWLTQVCSCIVNPFLGCCTAGCGALGCFITLGGIGAENSSTRHSYPYIR